MKKIILVLMLIICYNVQGQPYLSTGVLAKGVAINAGFLSGKLEISGGVKMPITDLEAPTILNLSIGRQVLLTHKEENNLGVTFSAGVASYRYTVFNEYTAEYVSKNIKAIYAAEVGRDAYLGRYYVKTWYCEKPFIEIGMRTFLSR